MRSAVLSAVGLGWGGRGRLGSLSPRRRPRSRRVNGPQPRQAGLLAVSAPPAPSNAARARGHELRVLARNCLVLPSPTHPQPPPAPPLSRTRSIGTPVHLPISRRHCAPARAPGGGPQFGARKKTHGLGHRSLDDRAENRAEDCAASPLHNSIFVDLTVCCGAFVTTSRHHALATRGQRQKKIAGAHRACNRGERCRCPHSLGAQQRHTTMRSLAKGAAQVRQCALLRVECAHPSERAERV